jgi:hypothetical protein
MSELTLAATKVNVTLETEGVEVATKFVSVHFGRARLDVDSMGMAAVKEGRVVRKRMIGICILVDVI